MAGPARLTPTGLQPGSAESFSTYVLGQPAAKTPLAGNESIPIIQGGITVRSSPGALALALPTVRTILTANVTVFVRLTGADSNTFTQAQSVGTPWATLQHAINIISETLDFAGFTVAVDVGPGTINGAVISGSVGGGSLIIFGSSGSGLTTLINQDGTNGTDPFDVVGLVTASINITGFKVAPVAGSFDAIGMFFPGTTLTLGGLGFDMIFVPVDGINMLFPDLLCNMTLQGTMTLNGSALSGGGFFGIEPFGKAVVQDSSNWTFTNNPNFGTGTGQAFLSIAAGALYQSFSSTYTGAFTGNFLAMFNDSSCAINLLSAAGVNSSNIVLDCSSSLTSSDQFAKMGVFRLAGAPASTNLEISTEGTFKDSNQSTATKGLVVYANDKGTIFPLTPVRTTFANLPATPHQGDMAAITDGKAINCGDGSCTTFGTSVTGGTGTLNLLIWYNGTNWTLMGK